MGTSAEAEDLERLSATLARIAPRLALEPQGDGFAWRWRGLEAFGLSTGAIEDESTFPLGCFERDVGAKVLEPKPALADLAKEVLDLRELRLRLGWIESLPGIVTADGRRMARVLSTVARVAPSVVPILLLGESGTGKELLARAIHAASPRSVGRFVAVNAAALSATLLESELFGKERGAFTGAERTRIGRAPSLR